jgi:hypothetical protein
MTQAYHVAAFSYSIHVNIAQIMNLITIVFPSLLAFSVTLMQIFSSSHSKLNLQSLCPFTNNVSYSFGFSFHLGLCHSVHFNTKHCSHLHLFVLCKIMSPTYKVNVPPLSIYKAHVFLTFTAYETTCCCLKCTGK